MAERNKLLGGVLISIFGLTVVNAAASRVWNPRMDCREKPEKVGNLTLCKDGDLIWISSDNGNPFPIEGKLQGVARFSDLHIVGFERENLNHVLFIEGGKVTNKIANVPLPDAIYKIKNGEAYFAEDAGDRIVYTAVDLKTGETRPVGEMDTFDER